MAVVHIELPPLARYQIDSIFSPEPYAVIDASTKAGKTIGCIYWLISEACNNGAPGREFWWVAPILGQAHIAFRRARKMLRETDPTHSVWTPNLTDKSITLANGAVIRFKSADDPDSLYGEDVYAAVIDEASRCKEDAWFAIRSTLTAVQGKLRVIGNVKGRKNWAYRLGQKAKAGRPGWHYARITADDAVKAGILKRADVEQAREDLPDHVFRELYMAEAMDGSSNPFGTEHIASCIGPLSTETPVAFGVDVARTRDYTVVTGIDRSGRVCRFDRWNQVPWSETIDRILGLIGPVCTLVDATGVGDAVVDALQRKAGAVEGFVFTEKSKQSLIEGLIVAVQRRQVTFPEGPIVAEMEMFEYEHTLNGVRYTAMDGAHDDCVMSLALASRHLTANPGTRFYSSAPDPAPTRRRDDWLDDDDD